MWTRSSNSLKTSKEQFIHWKNKNIKWILNMFWQNDLLTQSHNIILIPLWETYTAAGTVCSFSLFLPLSVSLSWISDTDKALKGQKMRDPQWDRAGGHYTDKGNADRHRPTHTYTHMRREALVCSLQESCKRYQQGGVTTVHQEWLTSTSCSVLQRNLTVEYYYFAKHLKCEL